MAALIRVVERLIAPLRRRVLLMVSRGVVRLVDEAPARQRLQVEGYAGEILDGVERVQEYGFTSCPPLGADAVVLACGGMRQHPIVIAVEDAPVRPDLYGVGDVALYTTRDGRRARTLNRHRIALLPQPDQRIRLHTQDGAGRRARVTMRLPLGGTSGEIESVVGIGTSPRASVVTQTASSITLQCGRSSLAITDAGITLRAPAIRMEQAT